MEAVCCVSRMQKKRGFYVMLGIYVEGQCDIEKTLAVLNVSISKALSLLEASGFNHHC